MQLERSEFVFNVLFTLRGFEQLCLIKMGNRKCSKIFLKINLETHCITNINVAIFLFFTDDVNEMSSG